MNNTRPEWPRVTADLPGIGGRLKVEPEDFLVEEIPAFEPSGEGEHLFLWIEKRGVSHEQLVRNVAKTLGVSRGDVGTAGMKDRLAVTRQWVSVPAQPQSAVDRLSEMDGVRILQTSRHPHKLRTGKLRGNRFEILVRDVVDNASQLAQAIAERIRRHGFPNYFGKQRFGRDDETLQSGFKLLRGEKTPKDLPASRRRFLLRLSLSAVQSFLFNEALAERIRDALCSTVLPGDVMRVTRSGGLFVAEDPAVEQPRLDAGEIAITGPMFGPKMRQPKDEAEGRETKLLESHGIASSDWSRFRKLTPGTRRAYCVIPRNMEIEPHADGLRFRFALPAGSYATVLLREFMKNAAD